jgi:osmotically-inducible protein OsmY
MRPGREIDRQLAGMIALGGIGNAALAEFAAGEIKGELPYGHRLITVAVRGGWVILQGEVEWNYQKNGAESVVRAIPWVKGISNELRVQPSTDAAQLARSVDAALGGARTPGSDARLRAWAA